MSDKNGWPPSVLRTRRRGRLSRLASAVRMKLQSSPLFGSLVYVLMLFGLAMLLSACATPSAPSSEPAQIPSPPPTTLSESTETFSSRAERNISEWQRKLIELLPK